MYPRASNAKPRNGATRKKVVRPVASATAARPSARSSGALRASAAKPSPVSAASTKEDACRQIVSRHPAGDQAGAQGGEIGGGEAEGRTIDHGVGREAGPTGGAALAVGSGAGGEGTTGRGAGHRDDERVPRRRSHGRWWSADRSPHRHRASPPSRQDRRDCRTAVRTLYLHAPEGAVLARRREVDRNRETEHNRAERESADEQRDKTQPAHKSLPRIAPPLLAVERHSGNNGYAHHALSRSIRNVCIVR